MSQDLNHVSDISVKIILV